MFAYFFDYYRIYWYYNAKTYIFSETLLRSSNIATAVQTLWLTAVKCQLLEMDSSKCNIRSRHAWSWPHYWTDCNATHQESINEQYLVRATAGIFIFGKNYLIFNIFWENFYQKSNIEAVLIKPYLFSSFTWWVQKNYSDATYAEDYFSSFWR